MANTPQHTSNRPSSDILSNREVIVSLQGRLNTLHAQLTRLSQLCLDSGQNLRESRLKLDAFVKGKSYDDAPDDLKTFHEALVDMGLNLDHVTTMIEQFEAGTVHVLEGALQLTYPTDA